MVILCVCSNVMWRFCPYLYAIPPQVYFGQTFLFFSCSQPFDSLSSYTVCIKKDWIIVLPVIFMHSVDFLIFWYFNIAFYTLCMILCFSLVFVVSLVTLCVQDRSLGGKAETKYVGLKA